MRGDYEMASDRFGNLKEKYDRLQAEYTKDKQFYEEALEARMAQLEELEVENEQLKRRAEEGHRKELELQSKLEQAEFDNEMLQRSLNVSIIRDIVEQQPIERATREEGRRNGL